MRACDCRFELADGRRIAAAAILREELYELCLYEFFGISNKVLKENINEIKELRWRYIDC